MSNKLSLLSRVVAVTGVLAITALPVLAQTGQNATPSTPAAPSASAPAAAPSTSKPADKHVSVDAGQKADKSKSQADANKTDKKHDNMAKTEDAQHKQVVQTPVSKKPEAPVKSDATK
jgi:hypothetical protein